MPRILFSLSLYGVMKKEAYTTLFFEYLVKPFVFGKTPRLYFYYVMLNNPGIMYTEVVKQDLLS